VSNANANGAPPGRKDAYHRQQIKPEGLPVHPAAIPPELKILPQWVAWDYSHNGKKWTKPPIDPKDGASGKNNDPTTWGTFEQALAYYERTGCSGIGFVFSADDPYAGVDLDDCRDPETGDIASWAQEIIERFATYTEVSPSETGVKLIGKATAARNCKTPAIEVTDHNLYFTLTGHHVGYRRIITDTQEAFDELIPWLTPKQEQRPPQQPERHHHHHHHDDRDDVALAREALGHLSASRCDQYDDWLRVGMALHSVDDSLLADWDYWSSGCTEKYRPGACAEKWRGFRRDGKVTLGTLRFWAKQDTGWIPTPPAGGGQATAPAAAASPGVDDPGKGIPTPPWEMPLPIPNSLASVQPFDYEMLPSAFRGFVEDIASRMQCPPDFPAVSIMVALAGVVGKKVGIRPKRHDDWIVVPNLWGMVVGRPGIMKTPAIGVPVKFLQRLQIEARKRYDQELQEYEDKKIAAKLQKKAKEDAMKEAIKKKRDPLEVAKQFNTEDPKEPVEQRYLVNNSTVEMLGVLLNRTPTGLTVFRDELIGLLRELDKEGQEGARAFYLEAWDGLGRFTYDRIGRGTLHIKSVTLSILGGATPAVMLDYLGAAIRGGRGDDGLMQRFQLAVYPDVERSWRNIDRWPDTMLKQRAWDVFQKLDTLEPETVGAEVGDGDDAVPFLRFDQDAQRLFDDWRAQLEQTVRSGDEHPALESHLAKYRSLAPSLALLIHLADGRQGAVSEEAIRKALAWAAYLETHARRIYGIATNSAPIAAKALAKRIMAGDLKDGFKLRDVYRKHWTGLCTREAVEQAVDMLIDLHWLVTATEETAGKSIVHHRIHPSLQRKTAPTPSAISAKSPFGTNGTDPTPQKKSEGQAEVSALDAKYGGLKQGVKKP
jgi:Protein of unknown function (DUF3987)/Primase C terminal 2 (PriCT-2)